MFRRVAIIGGGAASVSLLSELLDRPLPLSLHLDWYTGGDTPGRGVAYATTSDCHLLNVRAASMGLFSGRPSGFLDFIRRDDPSVTGTHFVPRSRYGDYLEAELEQTLQRGKFHGHDINIIPFEVDAVVPETDAVTVIRGEQTKRVDAAVLALGTLPPQPLPGVDTAALQSGRYVLDPWQLLAQNEQIPPPQRVILIGSGLTAADTVVELAARWPQTHFILVSRHGRLPERHRPKASAPSGGYDELIESLREAPDVRRWVRLLREAAAEEKDWRSLIDSLRPHTPGLWGELSTPQRARFLRHVRSAWERARHRMPPKVAATIDALEHSSHLQRLPGRVRSVRCINDRLRLTFSHGHDTHTLDADMVIQATGLATDVRRTSHRLISQLRTNAHVTGDALGLGLHATPDGCLKHASGHWSRLLAIGSLLRGTLWECTAMPEIRQQARAIAAHLLVD